MQPKLGVRDKYSGDVVAEIDRASPDDVEKALERARIAAGNPLAPAERHDVLVRAADLLLERRQGIEREYVAETGFTPGDAAGELDRAANVFRLSAGEAIRIAGEQVPVEASRGSENRLAFTMRIPVGVVVAIAPFNAPLVTVTHKIAPALAAGNAVLLKPAEVTPLSSRALASALLDAGLPPDYLQVLNGPGATVGQQLVEDRRVNFVTFTGSTKVGRSIREAAGLARTHLELGANSASIVAEDADLDLVTEITLRSGFRKAGQVCTSIQRLLVDQRVADSLADRLGQQVGEMVGGDPRDPSSSIGPMIDEREARRAEQWIDQSRGGPAVVVGGGRSGPVLQPTLVVDPADTSPLLIEEAFAPVVTIIPLPSFDHAVDLVNSGNYGLQTGVFTQDLDRAFDAAKRLRVGGVMINDSSSYHADAMPYGGVKDSGHGLEGPRYAVADMTDPRIVVLNLRPTYRSSR
jgi:acyl-CoA reductase-like NAD-dependent aldehyde dehydrogenase